MLALTGREVLLGELLSHDIQQLMRMPFTATDKQEALPPIGALTCVYLFGRWVRLRLAQVGGFVTR